MSSLKGPMEWPQLEALCSGYLHQDLAVVHGSALNAVQAWLKEASAEEVSDLSSEWRTFLNVTQGMELHDRARTLRELAGGAWEPASDAEFDDVSALLTDAWRTRQDDV